MKSRTAVLLAVAAAAAVACYSGAALAYCRATACDPSMTDCGASSHGCQTKGEPLQWKDGNVELLVDESGSAFRGISGEDTQHAVEAALTTWMSADCPGGGHPSFAANTELRADLKAAFVEDGANQNVITYLDGAWPYEAGAVAKTLIAFTYSPGEIIDADIVFNSAEFS